jgi:hypothetical protein
MIASHFTTEREVARIAADADIDRPRAHRIGAGHLLFAGRDGITVRPGQRP